MKKTTLKIHSFIDVITNSSTEIFIQASDKTIANLKSMIDNILIMSGTNKKCDELFTMKLVNRTKQEYAKHGNEYPEDYEFANIEVEVSPLIDSEEGKKASKILSSLTDLFNIEESYN